MHSRNFGVPTNELRKETEIKLEEEQYAFRCKKTTTDWTFSLRQLIEKKDWEFGRDFTFSIHRLWGGGGRQRGDWDFRISDLAKNPDGTDI